MPGVEGVMIRGRNPPHAMTVQGMTDGHHQSEGGLSPTPPASQHLEPGRMLSDLALGTPQITYEFGRLTCKNEKLSFPSARIAAW